MTNRTGKTSIRLGQIDGGSDVVLRPADGVVYRVSAFSTDGAWLYYTASEPRDLDNATVFQNCPHSAAFLKKLAERVSTYCVLSPDEKRIAFVRNNKKEKTSTLLLASVDGTDQRELTARPIEKAFFPGSVFVVSGWQAHRAQRGKLVQRERLCESRVRSIYRVDRGRDRSSS
jgi:hypothetical protein